MTKEDIAYRAEKTAGITARETGFLYEEFEYLNKYCGLGDEKLQLLLSCIMTINNVIRTFNDECKSKL